MRLLHHLLPACLLLTLGLGPIAAPPLAADPPNVVILLVDDMGWGDPGCFNPESKIPTPSIDALAKQGMAFTAGYSPCAVCVPTRYALLTGRHAFRMPGGAVKLPEDQTTLAGLLKQAGYRTHMIGKWHLGHSGPERPRDRVRLPDGPVDRGFGTYFGIPASLDIPPYYYIEDDRPVAAPIETIAANNSPGWSPIQGAFWRQGGIAPGFRHEDVTPLFTEKAVEWLLARGADDERRPFFLYLALPSPHTPWLPTEEFRGRGEAGMYGEFTAQVDATIGRVLDALQVIEQADNTLVFFSSDNGPVWYEADVERFGHASTGPFRGMKGDVWEGGTRVPTIVRWPGRVEPASRSDAPVSQTDWLATVAEAIGRPKPATAIDSHSFLPVLLGEAAGEDRVVVTLSSGGVTSIRQGPWKFIPQLGSGGFSRPQRVQPTPDGPTGQLYHLEDDPSETKNLFQEQPEQVERLQSLLAEIRQKSTPGP